MNSRIKLDNSVEIAFDKGGYKQIAKVFKKRLKKGHRKFMTERSYKIWLRYLRWRWLHNHPDFVKMQNRYYFKKRQLEKPYIAVCKRCGKEFNAARPYYKICLNCQNLPTLRQIKEKETKRRLKQKVKDIQEAQRLYNSGITQEVIAEHFGVTQKTISNWIHNKNKLKW